MLPEASDQSEAELRRIAGMIRTDRLDEARRACTAAFALGPPSDALLGLGVMLGMRSNDPAAAARHLEQLISRHPNDRTARLRLAEALIALDLFDRVMEVCAPLGDDPAAVRMAAYAAQQTGDLVRASALYRAIVARSPTDADSWANLGNVHAALAEIDAGILAFEHAITLRPTDARLYLNLAQILERADRNEARGRVMRSAAAVQPNDPEVQLRLGLAEAALEDFAAAEAALERSLSLAPDHVGAWLELGIIFENANRITDLDRLIDRARPHLDREISLMEAWSAFRHKRFDDAHRHAEMMPDTVNPMRRYHVQGEIADRRGDFSAAFSLFSQMNAASLASAPLAAPGPTYREMVIQNRLAARPSVAPRKMLVDDVPEPVFIVGFPRSGTTLLDTIVGRLPNTVVLEEQPLISAIEHNIGGVPNAGLLDQATISEHRQAYRSRLLSTVPAALGKLIIDKHPLHMARMPVIDALFPRAKILLVERHPYDVVLSCFVSNFHLNHAMRSFTNILEAALTYDAVLTAWTEARAMFNLNVHEVRYERLVSAPENEMRAALDFLGVEYEESILDTVAAAKERGRIRTASYAQVSEPIYSRSVARHERYRDQLEPVREILAPWAERLGYAV